MEFVSGPVVSLELNRLVEIGQRLLLLLVQEQGLRAPDVGTLIVWGELDRFGKIVPRFLSSLPRQIGEAAIFIIRRLLPICFNRRRKFRDRQIVLLLFKKLIPLVVLAHSSACFLFLFLFRRC